MHIVPAIDILDQRVVRLKQGDYSAVTHYFDDPLQVVQKFISLGYSRLHVIDLAGAKMGYPVATDQIRSIASTGAEVQVGGGIRTIAHARIYIDMGVKHLIIGTQSIVDPLFIEKLVQEFGSDTIIVSLDIRNGRLAINGWVNETSEPLENILKKLFSQRIRSVIITDINKDGTLSGVDAHFYETVVNNFPHMQFFAAGGIASQDDVKKLKSVGLAGVIIGKAFYENTINMGRHLC